MKISRLIAAAVVVAATCSTGPAGAVDEEWPDFHVLHTQTFSGDVWVAYRVSVPDGASVQISSRTTSSEATFGAANGWLLDESAAVVSDFPRGTSRATRYGRVMVDDAPVVGHLDKSVTDVKAGMGPHLLYHFDVGGVFTVISAGSSNAEQWGGTVQLEGTEGVALSATTIGSAELITEEEFEGMAFDVSVNGYRIRRAGEGRPHVARAIGSLLFGRFEGNASISYTGPSGGEEGAREYLLNALPAGDYRFQMDSVSSFTTQGTRFDPGRTFVLLADVTLPV